jgi:hypothetical protein
MYLRNFTNNCFNHTHLNCWLHIPNCINHIRTISFFSVYILFLQIDFSKFISFSTPTRAQCVKFLEYNELHICLLFNSILVQVFPQFGHTSLIFISNLW